MTQIRTLYNANVYIDGINHAGKSEEVTLPVVKPALVDHIALSMIGKIELPAGLDKMDSLKIKWNSIDPDIIKSTADFYTSRDIMIRSNGDVWMNGSRQSSEPVTIFLRGLSMGTPPIEFKHQQSPGIETEFTMSYYKMEINGAVMFEVDYYAQVYIVDGVDLMADYRANLGL